MSKARGLADLGNAFSDGALSNRNLVINGAMQVAQRGTSFSFSTGNALYTTVDRFEQAYFGTWGSNHSQITQATDAPDGFDRSLKVTALTAQDYSSALGSWIQYTFENQDIVGLRSGNGLKDFTISFWVKANKTGNVSVSLENDYSYSTYVTISAANTWERKTLTIPATTNNMGIDYAASPNGGDLKLKLGMGSNGSWLVDTDNQWNDATTNRGVLSPQQTNFHASVSDYIAFTGVQLEVGDTATPFEHRSYGDELARCQRYFERWNFPVTFDWYVTSTADHSHDVECPYNGAFVVTKRAAPTYSRSGTFIVSNLSSNDWTARPTTNSVTFFNGSNAAGRYYSYNDTSAYLDFDAEL